MGYVLAQPSEGSAALYELARDREWPLRELRRRISRFARSLLIVPDRPIGSISFDGTKVRVEPLAGWPADTAVIWALLPDMRDKHGVAMGTGHTGAFTTAAALPPLDPPGTRSRSHGLRVVW